MSRRRQPQRLPPPIMHGAEAIDSAVILREVGGEVGVALWKTVRSVVLWADLPARDRATAFGPEAHARRADLLSGVELPRALGAPLARAASVLQGRARAGTVARACRDVSDWAVGEGKLGTAIEFMQAAAVVLPHDAAVAHEVGRLARTHAEYQRAETWYCESVARARRAREWREFSRSYIGLGTVFALRGAYPQATKSLIRGLRAAKRFSIRPLVGAAAHELVVVGIQTDRAPEVARYARLAVEAYGPSHPRLPALAHDVGIFVLNAGYLEAARRILTATPPDYGRPIDQLAHAASLVRLAGALGDRAMYCAALSRADALLGAPCTGTCSVQAHLAIARGAASIGETERALQAATRARELATARGEAKLQFAVESVLQSIHGTPQAPEPAARTATPRPLESLVADLESALRAVPA